MYNYICSQSISFHLYLKNIGKQLELGLSIINDIKNLFQTHLLIEERNRKRIVSTKEK